jgi:acetyl-CoA carboxylase alpha subunit
MCDLAERDLAVAEAYRKGVEDTEARCVAVLEAADHEGFSQSLPLSPTVALGITRRDAQVRAVYLHLLSADLLEAAETGQLHRIPDLELREAMAVYGNREFERALFMAGSFISGEDRLVDSEAAQDFRARVARNVVRANPEEYASALRASHLAGYKQALQEAGDVICGKS